eukprot:753178-Hanusia_phi.AAC.7
MSNMARSVLEDRRRRYLQARMSCLGTEPQHTNSIQRIGENSNEWITEIVRGNQSDEQKAKVIVNFFFWRIRQSVDAGHLEKTKEIISMYITKSKRDSEFGSLALHVRRYCMHLQALKQRRTTDVPSSKVLYVKIQHAGTWARRGVRELPITGHGPDPLPAPLSPTRSIEGGQDSDGRPQRWQLDVRTMRLMYRQVQNRPLISKVTLANLPSVVTSCQQKDDSPITAMPAFLQGIYDWWSAMKTQMPVLRRLQGAWRA